MVVNAKEKTDNANKDKGKANICYQKKKKNISKHESCRS